MASSSSTSEEVIRVDGLGNMALINGFLADLGAETQKTLTSPRRLVRFWRLPRSSTCSLSESFGSSAFLRAGMKLR